MIKNRDISAVEALYNVSVKSRAVDLYEHLPTLLELGRQVGHITEMGVRHGFGSTAAFLLARPRKLVSYDIEPCVNQDIFAEAAETPWVFIQGSSLDVEIEPTDLIFIDTKHTYEQLRQELDLHHAAVSRYIVLHDTVSFGARGEDGSTPGLFQAALEFLLKNADTWRLKEHYTNCNGLMVMERIVKTPGQG